MSTKSLLLVALIAFAAGYHLCRYLHRPIQISPPHQAVRVQLEEGPKPPVYWQGGGGRLVPSNFSCVQQLAYCWWST